MFISPLNNQKIVFALLILFYSLFFFNLIMDARSSWSLTYIVILLVIFGTFSIQRPTFNLPITLIAVTSAMLISVSEVFIFEQQASSDLFFQKTSQDYIHQFLFACLFAFLPYLFYISHFRFKLFEKIIFLAIIFSLVYNLFLNFTLNLDRAAFAGHFKSVILYDYCIAGLSLIGISLSFHYKKPWSYALLIVCLLNLSLIVLHGSRGAWLGLPVILIFISFYFFKAKPTQTIVMLASSVILSVAMIFMPQSPVQERIEHLQHDTHLIQDQQNYNSSVGTRLALWQFSWEQFKASPWIGQGISSFRNQICNPDNRELVPNCQPHAHNVFFQSIAAYGIMGLLHLALVYFYPIWLFSRALFSKSSSVESKRIALSGTIFLFYIGICGLSDYVFFFEFPTMFYFLMVITLLSFLHNHKQHFFSSPSNNV